MCISLARNKGIHSNLVMHFSHKPNLTNRRLEPSFRRVLHMLSGWKSGTEARRGMRHQHNLDKDIELATTLLVVGALRDKRQQPVQLRDLERSVYSAIQAA